MNYELFESDELLALVAIELEQDKLASALEMLKYVKSTGVVSNELDSMLGSIYAKLQLFDKAAVHYEALIEREPTRLHEKFQLGMVYREQGNVEQALLCWDQVLEVEVNYPPVLFHKAVLLIVNDDQESAAFLLQQLISNTSEDNYYVARANEALSGLPDTVTSLNSELKVVN